MWVKRGIVDKPLAILIAILVVGGCMIFSSAAFGLLARGTTGITSVVFDHIVLGVGAGLICLLITMSLDHRIWQKYAPYLYGFALFLTALVFVPHLGSSHGGGARWVGVGPLSLQPSEGLKITSIMLASGYFSSIKNKITTFEYGMGGFLAILAGPAILLVAQPDLGTLGVVCISVLAVYWAAGARFRDIALLIIVGVLAIGILALIKPYVRERIETFFNPGQGQQSQGYQIKQSLIAVGSGELFGRGFGQGIQKFTYLPEPMGDSIFAVAGEELGFVGSVTIVLLFLGFALRGYAVAAHASDSFGGLLAVGISTYLGCEAFINIGSMLGVTPLTGIPLTFVSQGGTAMLASLASAGILLSISRGYKKKRS